MERVDPETGEILTGRREKAPWEAVAAAHKAACRSRTAVRRALMSGPFDHFLTLTYRDNQGDLEVAWRDFTRFARAMRDALGQFLYVAVAERQKRGAWHFHLGVIGKQDLKLCQRAWPHGWIRADRWKGPLSKMASYLSKYLSKSFTAEEIEGRRPHRFRRSQGLSPATFVETVTIDPNEAHDAMAGLFRDHGLVGCAVVSSGHAGQLQYFVWGSTWATAPP